MLTVAVGRSEGSARMRAPRRASAHLATSLALGLVACATPAAASPLFDTVGGVAGLHPLVARAAPTGSEAAYFDPSALVGLAHGGGSTQVSFVVVGESLSAAADPRPGGVDVPESVYDARAVGPGGATSRLAQRPLPTSRLERPGAGASRRARPFVSLGIVSELVEDRVALALHALLPVSTFQSQRPSFADEREQYFSNALRHELFGDRFDSPVFVLGLGVRATSWLELGAGVSTLTRARVASAVYIPDSADQQVALTNAGVDVSTTYAPHASVAVAPARGVRVAVSAYAPESQEVGGDTRIKFWSYPYPPGQSALAQTYAFSYGSLPLRTALAASVDLGRIGSLGSLRAAGQATFTQWSRYVDRHAERPVDAWHDTLAVAAGVDLEHGDWRFAGDAAWTPSPVPAQEGRSNYVDDDRVGAALTVAYRVRWGKREVVLSAGVTGQRLLPRHVRKSPGAADPVVDEFPDSVDATSGAPIAASHGLQTNNPGYPGFSSEGWIWSSTVGVRTGF